MGPGSAEQREGRCTASGTRAEFALAAFLHQTRLINLRRGHSVPRISSAARSGALLSRGPSRSVDMGPGSAEQREERCTASGTRAEFALAAFLHQTRLINLRRGHSVPRTQRSAQRCAAEPGSISQRRYGSRLCGAARRALQRVRDTRGARAAVVICPSGSFVSSPLCKNISVSTPPKSHLELFASRPTEGRIAIVTDAGWDAVDAAVLGAQRDAGRVL